MIIVRQNDNLSLKSKKTLNINWTDGFRNKIALPNKIVGSVWWNNEHCGQQCLTGLYPKRFRSFQKKNWDLTIRHIKDFQKNTAGNIVASVWHFDHKRGVRSFVKISTTWNGLMKVLTEVHAWGELCNFCKMSFFSDSDLLYDWSAHESVSSKQCRTKSRNEKYF